tara:strand:- start:53 stop:244 length:192 start_codon:yes stop_codon:yes gene_type:complete
MLVVVVGLDLVEQVLEGPAAVQLVVPILRDPQAGLQPHPTQVLVVEAVDTTTQGHREMVVLVL